MKMMKIMIYFKEKKYKQCLLNKLLNLNLIQNNKNNFKFQVIKKWILISSQMMNIL